MNPECSDSEFIEHIGCPNCNSSDACAVYSDGHTFCFSCSHFTAPVQSVKVAETKYRSQLYSGNDVIFGDSDNHWNSHGSNIMNGGSSSKKSLYFPDDAVSYLPVKVLNWLAKYEITRIETIEHEFMWSELQQCLIIPIRDAEGRLLAWQGRSFDIPSKRPKYLSYGEFKNVYDILSLNKTPIIILVEDKISAIKVSRQYTTMPLFGSYVDLQRIVRLSKLTDTGIGLWLDADKAKDAMKFRSRMLQFTKAFVILTKGDPKVYTDEQIKHFVDTSWRNAA